MTDSATTHYETAPEDRISLPHKLIYGLGGFVNNLLAAASGGMFYSRETPEHDVYVKEGDHFNAGDPLFIIEVMKMFNKYYAPFAGTVEKVLVESDGMIISKGQPIFKITPDERPVIESPEEVAARRREFTGLFLQQV